MLMDFHELVAKYGLNVDGVLHLGAHLAEEAATYAAYDAHVVWVEANPAVVAKIESVLRRHPKQRLVQALIYGADDVELDFNVTNYDGMSSSILEFGTHPEFSPDTVFVDKLRLLTTTVDTLVERHVVDANGLVMDLQGAEGPALAGATRFLDGVDYVMSEVNKAQVYVGATQVQELDRILVGFERVETYWVTNQGWGDALWVRRNT